MQSVRGRVLHLFDEEPGAMAPLGLRLVHRRVGAAEQRLGIVAVAREQADSQRRRHAQRVTGDLVRPRQPVEQSIRRRGRVLDTRGIGQDEHELVAADARHGVAGAQRLGESPRDCLQQLVADRVPERVVDGLEAIQVDEDHRRAAVAFARRRQRVVEALVQQPPVGQAGQRVVVRKVPDAPLGGFTLDDLPAQPGVGLGKRLGALAHADFELVMGAAQRLGRTSLLGDVFDDPDRSALGRVRRVDRLGANPPEEAAAVAAHHFVLEVHRLPARQQRTDVGADGGVVLARSPDHVAGLAGQRALRPADHFLEARIDVFEALLASETDADRGVFEDRLVLQQHLTQRALLARRRLPGGSRREFGWCVSHVGALVGQGLAIESVPQCSVQTGPVAARTGDRRRAGRGSLAVRPVVAGTRP